MPDKYIVRSPEPAQPIPECSVGEFLQRCIEKVDPDRLVMIVAGTEQKQTYSELNQIGLQLGSALLKLGIVNNDRTMFFATNSIDYFDLYLALAYLGLSFSPSTPANGPYETKQQLNDLNAKVLIVSRNKLPIIRQMLESNDLDQSEAISKLKLMIVLECDVSDSDYNAIINHSKRPKLIQTFDQMLALGRGLAPLSKVPHFAVSNPKTDPFTIVYTSGTTGLPKGSISSHRSFISSVMGMFNVGGFRECEKGVVAHIYPFGHISGTMFMPVYLHFQMTAVMFPNNDIRSLLFQSIETYRVNMLPLVQALAQNLYQNRDRLPKMFNLSSLRWLPFGGSKVGDQNLVETIQKIYHVRMEEFYGSTEVMGAIANLNPPPHPYGSAGIPVANSEMKIVNLQSKNGQSLPANQLGEIWIRSPCCFVGYLNNQKATEETVDRDGWYHSGDVGYYDEKGRLYMTDRIKELIKYKGWSIGPAEIENFLGTHQAVEGVCVVGVPHQTEGFHLRAYVKLRDGHSDNTELELVNFVKENMGYQKRLNNGVKFVTEIPRTIIGKVDRKFFRNLVKDELLTEPAAES